MFRLRNTVSSDHIRLIESTSDRIQIKIIFHFQFTSWNEVPYLVYSLQGSLIRINFSFKNAFFLKNEIFCWVDILIAKWSKDYLLSTSQIVYFKHISTNIHYSMTWPNLHHCWQIYFEYFHYFCRKISMQQFSLYGPDCNILV